MTDALTINDTSRDGLLVIADTSWDSNGTLLVTVRERIGGRDSWVGGLPVEKMRRFARRALPYPERTRSAREVRRHYCADGCWYITFAVSRLER